VVSVFSHNYQQADCVKLCSQLWATIADWFTRMIDQMRNLYMTCLQCKWIVTLYWLMLPRHTLS